MSELGYDDEPVEGHELLPEGYFIPQQIPPDTAILIGRILKGEVANPFDAYQVDALVRLLLTPPPIVKGF